MAQLVIAVGRDLAPHLKSLMGPWWFSQFDTVPEASQAAKHSLQAAFPAPEKRLDALILCTTEIFTYLEENLKLTPQDLSDKASAPDELKEMHQQVISSSMLALATLLDVLISLQSERPGFENIAAEPKHAAKARAITNTFAEKLFSNHRCFLDFLKSQSSAIRYLDGVDSISPARAILVENILVKLLWEDFVHFPLPNDKKRIFPGISCETSDDSNLSVQRTEDASIFKHPVNYIHELGKCIIGILSGIALVENDLPSVFGSTFQETCQQMLMHSGNGEGPEIIEQLIQFLSLLEQHAMRKGETWPLVQVLGPTVAKHFSSIKSIDAPNGVRFLSAAVTVFGARQIVHALLHGHRRTFCSDEQDKALESKQFMHIFNERFVPWCFGRSDSGTAARIDFLLTLLDDECFPEQWSTVVSYAVKLETTGVGLDLLHPDCVAVLSILLHKVRGEITRCKRKRCDYSQHSNANCWHNKLLDSAAVAVISSLPPFQKSAAEFLCSALGGATENDQIVLVSGDAFVLIYNNILEKLIDFILVSPLTWVKEAGCLLRIRETNVEPKDESFGNRIEMAKFALDVLSGSLYALTKLDEESELPTHILAAVFIISWECSIEGLLDEALSYELDNMKARFDSSKTVQSLCSKINKIFCQNLGVHSRKNVRIILAQSIRCTIFREQKLDPDKLTALCCTWMLAIVDCFCQDEDEEQHLLEQLLHQGDGWPLWCSEDVFIGLAYQKSEKTFLHRNVSESNRFVSLVDKLIQKRGIGRVIGGSILDPHCTSGRTVNFTSRAWLAAEILCTWEWPGGSAVTSFLPMLSLYAKNDANPLQEDGLLDSILDILLDAALVQEKTEAHNFSDAWIAPLEGLEHTEEPFLRALISLLATFFRHNIWGSDKAKILFELLVSKLFIGETVNVHCLRILPPIVSALVQPIFQSKKELNEELQAPFPGEDKVQITIIHWLERALSFPPLLTWHSGQDMEEWLLLVISCYPMNVSDRLKAPKPEWMISIKERTLLLDLFRKQRLGIGVLTACDHLESSQMLLSRLVAISSCYCGDDFAEEDWDFVLSQVKLWIQLAVVMMEDVAENVNDLISNLSTGDYLDNVVSKIENIVFIKDQFRVNIARNAILAFISFSRLQEVKDVNNLSSLAAERWDTIKDRILEAILRLFFCTGLAEAIAHSYSSEGASIVASSRLHNLFFWNLVAWGATGSSPQCRDRAVKSVDFWALGRGSISSLYAILFSSTPVPAMQFAGYVILSTEPVASVAIGEYVTSNMECDKDSGNVDLLSEQNVHLRKEISCMIEKSPYEILEMDLLAPERHLFLEFDTVPNLRKREKELPAGVCEAANVANEAILTGSVLSIVESFWPVQQQKMTLLAGAIFGMMVRLLPAYVRGWFSNLRDRSTSSAVESFTRTWCSPPLIANELSQIKKASFVDENFSVSVSKAANEVVATYTKDETGVDLVIRLPASYPLRAVDVDCTRSLGISELKQRKWLMSMMLFLSNQNGAIAEAIRIWKCNFDKEFEGVEECPICYSVIHTANHSLPRVACKTCKHKYHSACLNKWFSTSNKRNCPLCQSLF
ncbi:hypothetical protein CRG98_021141 [Punica granatum]|uniref:E3 ubiquitin-protein ligase listerin n=1 Tax=Punica granatum TaxID=22663 RepID=A0A2I0JSK5_PUNGR|nr:hypothetical protein CRG98_021141 [Punica granatum]